MDLELHAKQSLAFQSRATEILYGGAAGGGKSHLMRIASVVWCSEIPGLQVYLFRRVKDDLHKNHMEGPNGYRNLLREWVDQKLIEIVGDEVRFWNGSKIYLCHCKDERDRFKYQGAEIHVLLVDELTHFTEKVYRFLRGRVRAIGLEVPDKYKDIIPRIMCGSNPGNIGHNWVKAAFIDSAEPLALRHMGDFEGGMLRQYIPARLDDNPSMTDDDPLYRQRLRGLGSHALVKAMEDGDWNVVEGAYFDCWSTERHVIEPFEIPDHWIRARSFDWGSAKPFSVGWWAIANEEFYTPYGLYIQKGAVIRYREWYGAKGDDVGLKLDAEDVGKGIREREIEKVTYGVADPSIGKEDGGPSIRERMGVSFRMGDNRRVAGWDTMRQRLKGTEDGPMIFCFKTCTASIRTIPSLQHDDKRPEDLDTSMEDHCFAAGTMVRTPNGDIPIEKMTSGMVSSAAGMLLYRSGRLTKKDAETVKVSFSDGSSVVCTPDHKFLTISGIWVAAVDMTDERSYAVPKGAIVCQKSLATRFKSLMEKDITCVVNTFREKVKDSISLFGSHMKAMLKMVTASITATMTGLTMRDGTCYQCLMKIMQDTTPHTADMGKKQSRSHALLQMCGMDRRMERSGTERIIANTVGLHCTQKSTKAASSASISSLDLWGTGKSSAQTNARQQQEEKAVSIISHPHAKPAEMRLQNRSTVVLPHVRESAEASYLACTGVEKWSNQDVYCITVGYAGHFILANGAVVANCADEWRYFCMSRPWTRKLEEDRPPLDAPVTFDQVIKHSERMSKRNSGRRKRI